MKCNNNITRALGPQVALDMIRTAIFDGWPKHCRILEGRTRYPRGMKRNAQNSGIIRIPYPDEYTEQHRSGALHLIHELLDLKHNARKTTKHTHTDLWHGAAEHIGVRQGDKLMDELIVVPGGLVDSVLPEIVAAMHNGEVFIP